MKSIKITLFILLISSGLMAQASYDGALERYKMKSNEAVREGLVGEYYQGDNFQKLVKVRQEKEIYFDWKYKKPISELDAEYFSVRWKGKVYAEKGGKYVFTIYADDGMRLWLNGKLILNAWKDQPPTLYEKRVVLEKDQFYDIRIDYYQKQYQTTAAVFFNEDGQERQSLNARNTLFGRDLAASNALFDFWEEPSLIDQFWNWTGLKEEEEASINANQSFKIEKSETLVESVKKEQSQNIKQETKAASAISNRLEEKPKLLEEKEVQIVKNRYNEISVGETLVIENIYFDQGKARLRAESNKELDLLYEALKRIQTWEIKIDGHTDNVGFAALNLELSFDRARAVYFYLVNKGISKDRLTFEGFGSTKPLVLNNSEDNKQLNRRVEITMQQASYLTSD
jgi:outer membrane protein OmpA-like peptidoglycan-associated protein